MSTLLSSFSFDQIKEQTLASIVEVDFAPKDTTNIKAKHGYIKNSFSNATNFTESVVEIRGSIIVSF